MFIVFDTNVLIESIALNNQAGAAVRFYVQQKRAIVAIPEVVALEFEQRLTDSLLTWTGEISKNHRQLLAIFGNLPEVVVPTEHELRAKAAEVMRGLDVPTRHIPLSIEVTKSSLTKVIQKTPPSASTEQFRDGVIWAHCMTLLAEDDVYLVTKDKDFYEQRDYKQGLAKELLREANGAAHKLTLMQDLSELLASIRQDVHVDQEKLVRDVIATQKESIDRILGRVGFTMIYPPKVEVQLYATEVATRLYLEYTIEFQCEDVSGRKRPLAQLELKGRGAYDADTREYIRLQSSGEKLTYTDDEGEKKMQNHVLAVGDIVLGHRTVDHAVRVPLVGETGGQS